MLVTFIEAKFMPKAVLTWNFYF